MKIKVLRACAGKHGGDFPAIGEYQVGTEFDQWQKYETAPREFGMGQYQPHTVDKDQSTQIDFKFPPTQARQRKIRPIRFPIGL